MAVKRLTIGFTPKAPMTHQSLIGAAHKNSLNSIRSRRSRQGIRRPGEYRWSHVESGFSTNKNKSMAASNYNVHPIEELPKAEEFGNLKYFK
jgi:hypothetical protein